MTPAGGGGPRPAARRRGRAPRLAGDLPALESAACNDQTLHPPRARPATRPAPQRVPRDAPQRRARRASATARSRSATCCASAGYAAYVVGGAVRDLLLGIAPKDFDVATDARPEQVKPLFRRALHHRAALPPGARDARRPETVEVSTFRAADSQTRREKDEHGRVLRDNVFGNQEEDARRRDFTVNALYYDPASEEIVDYHGGLADLKKRTAAHDRRPGDALPRRPGAHAARGAAGGEARPHHRRRDARADPAPRAAARARAAGAPVRRDAQAAALGPRQRLPAPAARRRACTRACCRCST